MTGADTNKFSDVPVRIKSWGYIIVVFAAMLSHPFLMSVIVALLSLYALKEYFTMASVKSNLIRILVYTITVPVFISFHTNNYRLFVLSIILYIVIIFIILSIQLYCATSLRGGTTKQSRIKSKILDCFRQALAMTRHDAFGITLNTFFIKNIIAGIILCVFCIGHLSFIRELNNPQEQINGVKIVIYIVLLTELNDVFQYLTGKVFGKKKITPMISPNKTIEGFLGGIILTTLLANILGIFLFPQKSIVIYTVIGILIAVLGFCGDLLMSFIKRRFHVKDTGTLIPGHGGLLDRMDSLLFVLPLSYWGTILMYFK